MRGRGGQKWPNLALHNLWTAPQNVTNAGFSGYTTWLTHHNIFSLDISKNFLSNSKWNAFIFRHSPWIIWCCCVTCVTSSHGVMEDGSEYCIGSNWSKSPASVKSRIRFFFLFLLFNCKDYRIPQDRSIHGHHPCCTLKTLTTNWHIYTVETLITLLENLENLSSRFSKYSRFRGIQGFQGIQSFQVIQGFQDRFSRWHRGWWP